MSGAFVAMAQKMTQVEGELISNWVDIVTFDDTKVVTPWDN